MIKTAEIGYRGQGPAARGALRAHVVVAEQHMLNGNQVPEVVAAALTDTPTKVSKEVVTAAYVSDGRWVVDCPFCSSAQLASVEDPHYLCTDCGNAPVGGMWVKVIWPKPKDRAEIEKLLLRRPPGHRHWTVGETVANLAAENVEHGILS